NGSVLPSPFRILRIRQLARRTLPPDVRKTGRRCPDVKFIRDLVPYGHHSGAHPSLPPNAAPRSLVCVAEQSAPGSRQYRSTRDARPPSVGGTVSNEVIDRCCN